MKKLLAYKTSRLLILTVAVIIGLYLIFSVLVKAQSFFAPLVTAVVLSLIILPLTQRLERVMSKTLASLVSCMILFIFSLAMVGLVLLQISNFTDSWPNIKETMKPKIENFQNYAIKNTPLTKTDFKDFGNQVSISESGFSLRKTGKRVSNVLMGTVGFLGIFLLTYIYIFFLLRYREMFKDFLLAITKKSRKSNLIKILSESSKVATKYLQGKLILIGLLTVVYSIGLGISGVSNFILVSIIAAVLTLIPYIGNLIGFAMALAFGYLTTGSPMTLFGIALTFTISQFLESYVLQPFVVGDKVDVHPFFIIVSVILGNFLWGIIGMVLAIPVLAIIAVTFQNIPELRAIGLLLSTKSIGNKVE